MRRKHLLRLPKVYHKPLQAFNYVSQIPFPLQNVCQKHPCRLLQAHHKHFLEQEQFKQMGRRTRTVKLHTYANVLALTLFSQLHLRRVLRKEPLLSHYYHQHYHRSRRCSIIITVYRASSPTTVLSGTNLLRICVKLSWRRDIRRGPYRIETPC